MTTALIASDRCESPYRQEETIVWDSPPSSPFDTEAAHSRKASADWQAREANAETDAIFEDTYDHTKVSEETQHMSTEIGAGKENASPERGLETGVQKPFTPMKHMMEKEDSGTISRGRDTTMMPPPSTTKRPLHTSPKKSSAFSSSQMNVTPKSAVPKRSDLCDPPQMLDDFSLIGDETNVDDTCFSTFSAVPDMTLFAKLGENRTPRAQTQQATPRSERKECAGSRSPSPTPRRQQSATKDGNTTSLLLDFTQQMESFAAQPPRQTPSRQGRLSPSRTEPVLLSHLNSQRSPVKGGIRGGSRQSNLMNLLDFELPPPPTPRSAPAFSVREVESLKSSFQSQISSIKAKLSGKEAEVESLKKALEDAERRVGEAQEMTRDEQVKREQSEQEKMDWEKRGLDVEKVLQTVKDEVLKSEAEKEALLRRAEEGERRADEADMRNLDLQARLASLPTVTNGDGSTAGGVSGEEIQKLVQSQLDQKIESVSRELHSVYKKKHETKVATLKKSYEARGEKKITEMQEKIERLSRENEDLHAAKEATFSGELGAGHVSQDEHTNTRQALDMCRAEIEEQHARSVGLGEEMKTLRGDHSRLMRDLERERVEKGELVAAVDEMLGLQASEGAQGAIEDFRRSISRPSGLRAPGAPSGPVGDSRIGKRNTGLPARPGAGKSKMMSQIERMGSGTRTTE